MQFTSITTAKQGHTRTFVIPDELLHDGQPFDWLRAANQTNNPTEKTSCTGLAAAAFVQQCEADSVQGDNPVPASSKYEIYPSVFATLDNTLNAIDLTTLTLKDYAARVAHYLTLAAEQFDYLNAKKPQGASVEALRAASSRMGADAVVPVPRHTPEYVFGAVASVSIPAVAIKRAVAEALYPVIRENHSPSAIANAIVGALMAEED